jgi:hypothetical protein
MTVHSLPKPGHPNAIGADRLVRHLNQIDLSRRWKLSHRTLERWRWLRQGPNYLKIGGRIVYRIEDVEAFEAAQLQRPKTSLSLK